MVAQTMVKYIKLDCYFSNRLLISKIILIKLLDEIRQRVGHEQVDWEHDQAFRRGRELEQFSGKFAGKILGTRRSPVQETVCRRVQKGASVVGKVCSLKQNDCHWCIFTVSFNVH